MGEQAEGAAKAERAEEEEKVRIRRAARGDGGAEVEPVGGEACEQVKGEPTAEVVAHHMPATCLRSSGGMGGRVGGRAGRCGVWAL